MLKNQKLSVLFCVLLAGVLLLSSCGSSVNHEALKNTDDGAAYDIMTQSSSSYVSQPKFADPEAKIMYDYEYSADQENGTGVSLTTVLEEQSDRKIIYNSWAEVETKEYDKTISALKTLCAKYSAYFESSDSYGGNIGSSTERRSNFSIRIPVENYPEFVNEVSGIGTVISSGENNRDVTEQYYDTEARLESAKLREERVLVLLANAGSLDDILALERELSDIRYEIESLTGSLRKYDSLISYATFTLSVNEVIEYTKPVVVPLTFGEKVAQSFSSGLESFIEGWQGFVIVLTYNVFNIITFAVISLVIVTVIILAVRKPKKARKQDVIEEKKEE
ncbi:MAG: DUF4349 domain-containing protein [Clostridia bacterium]|nr:DUF4349 domain-containing protein [Clostridia bacterium]